MQGGFSPGSRRKFPPGDRSSSEMEQEADGYDPRKGLAMTRDQRQTAVPDGLSLSALLARYVETQIEAHREGSLFTELPDDVQLHDPGAQPLLDVRQVWGEAMLALRYSPFGAKPVLPVFQDWSVLATAQEPVVALPWCVGNYPQMVRALTPLLEGVRLPSHPVPLSRPAPLASIRSWIQRIVPRCGPAGVLTVVGMLRLAHAFEEARTLLDQENPADASWADAWQNERAALAWHTGRVQEAIALWGSGSGTHMPTVFNRGLAALCQGQLAEARKNLQMVVAAIPETGGWHHLGHLYLTLTEA